MNKITRCLICKKKISDTDLNFEDYYTVSRGNSAEVGCLHFDCFHVATNPDKTAIFDKNGVKAKL